MRQNHVPIPPSRARRGRLAGRLPRLVDDHGQHVLLAVPSADDDHAVLFLVGRAHGPAHGVEPGHVVPGPEPVIGTRTVSAG